MMSAFTAKANLVMVYRNRLFPSPEYREIIRRKLHYPRMEVMTAVLGRYFFSFISGR